MWWNSKKIVMLQNRIKDLERTVEIITGANQVLTTELEQAKEREANLLDKLFSVVGLNSKTQTSSITGKPPINLGKNIKSWSKTREELEVKARAEVWLQKKAEMDAKSRTEQDNNIKNLEEKILGG